MPRRSCMDPQIVFLCATARRRTTATLTPAQTTAAKSAASSVDAHHAAQTPTSSGDNPDTLPPEVLNENETIIGIGEESCPKPLRLFEAWNASTGKLNAEAAKVAQAEVQQRSGGEHPTASSVVTQVASKEIVRTTIAVDMIDIARGLSRSSKARADLESLAAAQAEAQQQQPLEALAVPTGKPLSIFDATALPAAYTEFLFGDCVPFLKRDTPVTAQQIFDALPSREELQYDLEVDVEPYRASDRSRWDTAEFHAVFCSCLRSLKILQSVKASLDRPGFEKDFQTIASTTSQDFTEAALHPSAPRSNQDLIHTAGNERVRTALRHLGCSTAKVPLTDGNKMKLHHFGCAMNQIFGPLTVFHTHNYADIYSPEMLKMQSSEPPVIGYVQNIVMPTVQKMHQITAASPRSTAKLFLLMEELSYRHLYRVDKAWLGNFKLTCPTGGLCREDEFASNGLRGLADFVTALFKCIESQQRGFAHGHGKVHSIPDGTQGLLRCLEDVLKEINAIQEASGGAHPAEEVVDVIVANRIQSYNKSLIDSASTRQYESATLPAKQLGVMLPDAPFTEKQQRQSRYDGGVEADQVTPRPLVSVQPAEPYAHVSRNRRRLNFEHQLRGNDYKELPLTGCQLCIAPHYLLPQSFGQEFPFGDEGEADDSDVAQLAGPPWVFDEASGELQHFLADLTGSIAQAHDFRADAIVFERCFGRDVRFLHHHDHDHDCSGTCVKNVKKKTKEVLSEMIKANRAPPCRFEFYHVVMLQLCDKMTKIRRRGKEVVDTPHIVNATTRNQFGSVALERPQPFRSASSDCALGSLRCNNDFRYMPEGFPDATDLDQLFRCDVEQLAACFRSTRAAIKAYKSVRRMAMSVVAAHVAANIIDYYITKYAAKPMEQLQNLVTQYALGLRRLELEEAEEEKAVGVAATGAQPVNDQARGRRVLLKLQYAANRSKWISSTECALYVHTEQQHWTSHNEVPMFLSRPLYLILECKRILAGSKSILTRAATPTQFAVMSYGCRDGSTPGDGAHLASEQPADKTRGDGAQPVSDQTHLATRQNNLDAPTGLPNIGNTCFMNALLQCFKQMLLRLPSDHMPKSQRCPLASALRQHAFSEEELAQWECWTYLPVGPQRACHVLEMCLDGQGPMHSDCVPGDCYGELLRNITSFDLTRQALCDSCPYASQDSQRQCVLRVESDTSVEAAMHSSFGVRGMEDFACESCGARQARQQTLLGDLPHFLVVHVNKHAECSGPTTDANARVSGTELQRIAVLHHTGHSTESGHYTCTLSTQGGQTYHCNDETIEPKPGLGVRPWENSYLVFLHSKTHGAAHPAEDDVSARGDAHPVEDDSKSVSVRSDAHPSDDEEGGDKIDDGGDDHCSDEDSRGDAHPATEEPEHTVQATECRVTSTRHDDWLHRGPFLADLPWHVYMRRVRRARKPTRAKADYSQTFFFDRHYSLACIAKLCSIRRQLRFRVSWDRSAHQRNRMTESHMPHTSSCSFLELAALESSTVPIH